MRKYLLLYFLLSTILFELNAQKTCLVGNCINGPSTLLNAKGDTVITNYKDGKPTDELLYASKNYGKFSVTSIDVKKWYLDKREDTITIGKGVILEGKLTRDTEKPGYKIIKNGDRSLYFDNTIITFQVGQPIRAYINNKLNNQNRLEIVSNGNDYVLYNIEAGKIINGFMYINKTNSFIHFYAVNTVATLYNPNDQQVFSEKMKALSSFTLYGFDEYYYNNFTNQRTIASLELYILRLKNSLLKPLDAFVTIVENAKVEFENFTQKQKTAIESTKKNTTTLTYEAWRDLLKKEVIEICKTQFKQEYEDFLFDQKLSGLPTKEDEILYNLSRDGNNIISLLDDNSNESLKFLQNAFKIAFAKLNKTNSYIVPSALRKYYDSKRKKYDFQLKLGE